MDGDAELALSVLELVQFSERAASEQVRRRTATGANRGAGAPKRAVDVARIEAPLPFCEEIGRR